MNTETIKTSSTEIGAFYKDLLADLQRQVEKQYGTKAKPKEIASLLKKQVRLIDKGAEVTYIQIPGSKLRNLGTQDPFGEGPVGASFWSALVNLGFPFNARDFKFRFGMCWDIKSKKTGQTLSLVYSSLDSMCRFYLSAPKTKTGK